MTDEGNITDAEVQLAVARVKLPEPDTTHYHTHPGSSVKYWSDDQIISYAQACVRAASRVRPAGEPVAWTVSAPSDPDTSITLTQTDVVKTLKEFLAGGYDPASEAALVVAIKLALYASQAPSYADAIRDIAAERERQTAKEGWSPAHDDEHDAGELAIAAACYIAPNVFPPATVPHHYESTGSARYADDASPMTRPVGSVEVPSLWPWDGQWWKPSDRRRNLVKAGALIAAEIDRLDRIEALTPGSPL